MKDERPLWEPDQTFIQQSFLYDYMQWIYAYKGLLFSNYEELRKWSIEDLEGFWESFVVYAKVHFHTPWNKVLKKVPGMIGTKWFEGSTLNYAEHIFRHKNDAFPAIQFRNERKEEKEIIWKELELAVGRLALWMKTKGIKKGDRVVSLMPNIPETVMAFLAANSIGAIWSSCSPDFGKEAILDRFQQIEPALLFITDGYTYNGKVYERSTEWEEVVASLPSLKDVVLFNYIGDQPSRSTTDWNAIMQLPEVELTFESLPFDHPIWILYSSGTTGKPKPIVHSTGGNLIEHLKVLMLHWDVKKGERFFWYSTTGWMMWNFSIASLLVGATVMLYDGSASYPSIPVLWDWVSKKQIHHFGGGASFFMASMKNDDNIQKGEYSHLRTLGSTGSPLPADCFKWVYEKINKKVWLISFSGGTDICSGFVGGAPVLPVFAGEISCRLLGVALEAWDAEGNAQIDTPGELIIKEPMPSMPLYFWKDEGNKRYTESYYSTFPGVWRHGDWVEITNRATVIIYGRSDATLNRDGVRIGTAEIYAVVEQIAEIEDSIVVGIDKEDGSYYMPLYVKLRKGYTLTEELKNRIRYTLRSKNSPRHVPDEIFEIDEIPYTTNGKKKEIEFKKSLVVSH